MSPDRRIVRKRMVQNDSSRTCREKTDDRQKRQHVLTRQKRHHICNKNAKNNPNSARGNYTVVRNRTPLIFRTNKGHSI